MLRSITCLVATGILAAAPTQAYQPHAEETWNREDALRVSSEYDTTGQHQLLRQMTEAGDSESQLAALRDIDARSDWPAPVREKLLLDYVNELRQEPPGSVSAEVLEFLGAYPEAVLVPHEDHPSAGIPLFNIRAATAGVLNGWTRQEAAFTGATLLAEEPSTLVTAWLEESRPAARRGFVEALSTASRPQLLAVGASAREQIRQHPKLLELAGQAALLSQDTETLHMLMKGPGGKDMHRLLRQAAGSLTGGDLAMLLGAALQSENPETAALAISILSPSLAAESVEPLLLEQLGDAELGAAAAMALAANPASRTRQSLETLAATSEDRLTATRARLALDHLGPKTDREGAR